MTISKEGEKAFPSEACGFLIGHEEPQGKRVLSVVPTQNHRAPEEQHHRFTITPEDFLACEKLARNQGQDIIGFYHSHPNAEARPSDYDREHAWPWYSYLIVSVREGRAQNTTSWILKSDRGLFDEEPIVCEA